MGEVTYYENDWERDLARLYLGPSTSPTFTPITTRLKEVTNSTSNFMEGYVPVEGFRNINDLPIELLCKIFEHCVVDFSPIAAGKLSTPQVLSRVSMKWYQIVTGLPPLWNDILIDCGDWALMPQLTQAAHYHLRHSGDLPLTIRTMGSPSLHAPEDKLAIQTLVSSYGSRIRHLTLSFPVDWMNNFLRHTANPADVESLESIKLIYHPTAESAHLTENNLFTHANALRKVEIEYASELGWKFLESNSLSLPWDQITELSLIHVVASPSYLQSLLVNCTVLEKCTLSIIKASDDPDLHFPFFITTPHQHHHVNLPTIKDLTLYNPKNFDYSKYLAAVRVHFTSLEHFRVSSSGDVRNGRQWSHTQFSTILADNLVPLRSVSTPAHINECDIESVIGEVPSLQELDVREGHPISDTTIRLMTQGYLGSKLEVLKCAVAPDMLSAFLDMVEGRYVSRKSKAVYRGFKKVVIRCSKNTDGYKEVRTRIEELRECGRDITVVEN